MPVCITYNTGSNRKTKQRDREGSTENISKQGGSLASRIHKVGGREKGRCDKIQSGAVVVSI